MDLWGRNIPGRRNGNYKGHVTGGSSLVPLSISRGQGVSSNSWEEGVKDQVMAWSLHVLLTFSLKVSSRGVDTT